MERNSLAFVQRLGFMRMLLGLPGDAPVRLQLASRDGARTRQLELGETTGRSVPRPESESRILDGNVGYLRIATMDARAAAEVNRLMPQFRGTVGLIVDVRGNGGGTRDALRALFPYLMSQTEAPRVVNAAKYRLHPEYREDHLGGSRFMYSESWEGWTHEERAAIAQFKTTFRPQWTPPEAEFSDWHYLVMSRRTNPEAFVYGKPVVVLLDAGSFSATDIFVNALKGWHDVTLVGTPSGGGSARQVPVTLPISRLSFTLASMASFQWSGRLYDGNGTAPDVVVHPEPEYFLVGGRDNVLEQAIALLR
jgi:C-terminal processing protease CtpA/Prc